MNSPPISSTGIHAGLVIGRERADPSNLRFAGEMFTVCKDGNRVASAPASEIMGGPLHSLRWLVNFLTAGGGALEEGSLVIPGSPVELVPIDRETELKVVIGDVGEVCARFRQTG